MQELKLQVKLVILLLLQAPTAMQDSYNLITGYLCINSNFTVTALGSYSEIGCATLCNRKLRCQAFSLADGPCQLFVFDKCSKSVRDCSCSRRGQVFVKQQPGLEAGALCPSGYGDDLCGVKYKTHFVQSPASMTWYQGREKCETDGGLAMMADMTSDSENQHMLYLYNKYMTGIGDMFLGGFQAPGSVEPAGGWSWLPCNITIDPTFWSAGEPGNYQPELENTVGKWGTGIGDFHPGGANTLGMLCECLSPFE